MNTLLVVLRNWILRENGQKPSISFDRTPTRFLAIASIVVPVVSIKGTILKDKGFVHTHVGPTSFGRPINRTNLGLSHP